MKTMKCLSGMVARGWLHSIGRALAVASIAHMAGLGMSADGPVSLRGLTAEARIARDDYGMAHVYARNDHDLFFLQGYAQAEDRLFQMDVSRRLGSGQLAELLGEEALPMDVQLRTIGLHRAAERSLSVLSPRVRAVVEAYAAGVNAFVASHPLPPEYGVLELTRFEPWAPLDTVIVAKLITFQRSFDLDIEPTITLLTYQQAGQALGFDGTALYFEDLFRTAPFDPAVTLPDAAVAFTGNVAGSDLRARTELAAAGRLHPAAMKLC